LPFEDLFPFKERPPDERYEHEIAPSAQVAPGAPTRTPPPSGLIGHSGLYRMAFRAMEVPGFPDNLRIGPAELVQARGPIWTQRTHIRQQPGWRPVYLKKMEHLQLGDGEWLTICQLPVTIPDDVARAMVTWRDRTTAAVAFAAAVLDERVAQELLAEDLLIFEADGSSVIGVLDHVEKLRKFQAANRMLEPHRAALELIGSRFDLERESPVIAAARWYLRAAQLGPVADAVVFLWIALEALAKPPYGTKMSGQEKKRSDVAWVEMAVSEAGVDPAQVAPTIGRLAGLRAEVVHGGLEQPELLHEGYYALEQIVRLLLRHRLGIAPLGWPLSPDVSNLRPPLRQIAELLHQRTETRWIS
jgi:hypothetical protein